MTSSWPPPPPPPPPPGSRRSRLESVRKERRRKRTFLGTLLLIGGIGLTALLVLLVAREVTRSDETPAPAPTVAEDPVTALLAFGTAGPDDDERMVWANLLVHDREEDTAAVVYIPASTAVEVPGRGLQGLDEAWRGGGTPLLLVAVENLLGITLDRYVQMAVNDARIFTEQIGELTVNVPEEVRVSAGGGTQRLLFSSGLQSLPPSFLVDLLYERGVDRDQLELGGRHLAFWDALFEHAAEDPDAFRSQLRDASAAFTKSDAPAEDITTFLARVAAVDDNEPSVRLLPVSSLDVPGDRLYSVDAEEVEALMAEIAGAATAEEQVRVQVLNGNGAPGIGQAVAQRLIGEGFRVVLTGNARTLDHRKTLIVVYENTPEQLALGERARALLGVGEVRVSGQDQGIVDMTIVVGKDFLRSQ